MHPAPLKQLEERLYSQMPLVGGCLRQRAAQALVRDGSPDAVRILAKAIARSDDRKVLAIALDALRWIRKPSCIDEVCAVWAVTRHKDLANLLIEKGWIASAPVDVKVLSALKAGQLKVVTKGGAEIVEPLLKAFNDADSEIASRASQCAIALTNLDAVDYLCERWLKTRDRLLEQLILQGKYVARKPIEARLLSALKVEQLEVITKGGIEVIEPLIKALKDTEREIAHRANQCIAALTSPDAIDYLCQKWVQTRNKLLEQAIVTQRYVARQPIEVKVLSALKAGQRALVIEGGAEIVEPLLTAFSDEDREIVSCAKQCANTLVNPDAIDYLCDRWVSTRDRLLEQVILQGDYVAQKPIEVRVLTALKTGKGQKIARDEAQIITLLLQACKDADPKIASEATAMLGKLQNQVTIDVLCSEWAKTRANHLKEALQHGQYVAASPIEVRVLSALKVGKLEVVINGGTEVVELLLQACKDTDSDIAKCGESALQKMKNPEAQEFLCNLVIDQDHQLACKVAVAGQYKPRDSNQRALFLFLTEQWDKYESLDYEHTILQTLYELGDEQLRKRVAQKARQAGRVEWTQIVAGGRQGKRLGEMSAAEWETTLAVLSEGKHWEEIWQLAQAAPPLWSVRLLGQLKDAGWVPKTELADFVQMVQKCVANVPDKLNSLWLSQTTLHEHSHSVKCLVINPDGKLLASSDENTIRLWNLPDGKLLQTFRALNLLDGKLLQTLNEHIHFHPIIDDLAISPDAKLLVSSGDNTIILWSLPDGKRLQVLTNPIFDWFVCPVISPDGKLLACGDNNTIRLWSLPDGQLLKTLTGHSGWVYCLAISPDDRLLASSGRDHTVKLWSLPDGELLQTLGGHSDWVHCLAISPDSRLLASGSRDHTIRLWSLPDGKPLQTLSGHSSSVNCLVFSPDGKLLASSGSRENTVRLWASGLHYLSRLPVEQMSRENMQWVQKALQNKTISEAERDWLKFIQALVSWRRRFDVEVEEAPQRIDAGEFDIEIEG